jgi:alpha-tubulin suppressor-like RCC1 family protein
MFGNKSPSVSPIKVDTNVWTSVACGGSHTVAVKYDGTLWGWGLNGYGQVGDGTTTDRTAPVQIGTDTNWASVSCGENHTIAVKTTGTLWAWGYNNVGQLGDGTTTNRTAPVQIGSDTNWSKIAAGPRHNMAIKTTGTLYAWGQNGGGQFGVETVTFRGGRGEQANKRNVLDPTEVGTLIDNRISSIWAYAIPGKNAVRDYNYYYYYYYDTDGSHIDPHISNTLAVAVISPNSRKT